MNCKAGSARPCSRVACHVERTNGRRPKGLKSMSKHLNIKPCVLPQFLTLQLWIYIPLQVVLFSSFRADEKKQKARHRVKNSPTFLCSGISLKYPSVEKLLSFKLFLLIFG
ncbi:MAG: hypothetical protein J6Q48_04375, partial [Bacteroidaceae bacterium]|nr:hypothetical protein [Bacteroidaceae bacterium]